MQFVCTLKMEFKAKSMNNIVVGMQQHFVQLKLDG